MAVYHVLKDGTKVETVRGHVVKRADAEAVYALVETINRNRMKERQNETEDHYGSNGR